ncbi:hypothetical protein [Mycolicibacterium sp. 120270]|uniref:hypothetical protein n=1 Tax=Mycolicibacterium sp. 120270 TaxID=3090600 RepID=UPI00299D0AE2|nr:hypothetical protein [Mycolicibacterium sp. 120270]MDX1886926.1 hypothetical protein [Mycolicibacterium sp. 120270]
MRVPAGVVTRTLVMVRPLPGHVSVEDARTERTVLSVQWGEVLMRFTSAEQVWTVLEAFGAVRQALRGAVGTEVLDGGCTELWPGFSAVSVTWTRAPEWSVAVQEDYDELRRRRVCWVDVVMGPVVWRVVDWAGFEAGLVLWRNALRTAVGVFVGGGRWRCDPSREGRV